MAHWSEIEAEAGEFAAKVREKLDAHVHKTMATLRKDGSPRISGTEARFADGDLWFGAMWQSMKALDLLRDPRFALHSASVDPPEGRPETWTGDAKVAGRAVAVTDPDEMARALGGFDEVPPGPSHVFRADLDEVVLISVTSDTLIVESWHPGRGYRRRERQ